LSKLVTIPLTLHKSFLQKESGSLPDEVTALPPLKVHTSI